MSFSVCVQCDLVMNVSAADRCAFVKNTPDCNLEDGFLNYLNLAFCLLPPNLTPLTITLCVRCVCKMCVCVQRETAAELSFEEDDFARRTRNDHTSVLRHSGCFSMSNTLAWLHMSSESLASEARQEYFLAFGKRRVEQASKCAGVRHMRSPALHLSPQIWGNWSVHKALWGFTYAGLGRIPSMLDIGTVLRRHSMT